MGGPTQTKAEVFDSYGTELTRFATSLVGPSLAPDIVVDAMVRTMWSDHWDDVHHPRAYLYKAVLDQARMHHRAEGRRRGRERRATPPAGEVSFEPEIDMFSVLDQLATEERAVIFLTYWEDLTERDAADRLGVSDRTVRRRLTAAHRKLGRLLEVTEPDDGRRTTRRVDSIPWGAPPCESRSWGPSR